MSRRRGKRRSDRDIPQLIPMPRWADSLLTRRPKNQHAKLSAIPIKPQPAREQIAIKDLGPGVRVGWLTILSKARGGLTPVVCRCVCEAILLPRARDLSEGKWLHCGLVFDPSTGLGHGWPAIPAGPSRRADLGVLPLAA